MQEKNTMGFELERLAGLLKIGIYVYGKTGVCSYGTDLESNPLFGCKELRERLMRLAEEREAPCILKDESQVCFACMKGDGEYFLLGPMSLNLPERLELHHFYQRYGVAGAKEKELRKFALPEVLDIVGLFGKLITGREYSDEELIYTNRIAVNEKEQEEKEQILFALEKEEEELFHHTYQEEQRLLDSVREGRVEDAVWLSRRIDARLGKLSANEINHWKNAAIAAVTLCTRAAIEGGLSPSDSYRLSDFYIQKCDGCRDIAQLLEYRKHAVEEFAGRVRKQLKSKSYSGYVSRCKDYVHKNYQKKIYLDDIAANLGISTGYLSRLFKKETGIQLSDYILRVRVEHAANLLKYSDESLARIAEYVNFPSQSYFGRVFKKYKNMSPKKYREEYRTREFIEDDGYNDKKSTN